MTTLPRPESPPNAVRVSADTVLITGAATGIGALAARSLAPRGHTVYASMRDPDGADASRAEALREGVDGDIRTLELDVLNDATVDAAVGRIIEESGRIDVLVNNAGHMYYGITEAFTPDELMSSYATNCAGAHRVTRAVLPHMRRQREGLPPWIGSGSTRAIPPYLGPYAIAKAPFDALAESFAWDVESLGIDTTIIHPGVFTEGTCHFADAEQATDATRASEYDGTPANSLTCLAIRWGRPRRTGCRSRGSAKCPALGAWRHGPLRRCRAPLAWGANWARGHEARVVRSVLIA
jgi:NAD(P)-dependent dehydrogenase (short-subunit alcohol dehydrogenase family)